MLKTKDIEMQNVEGEIHKKDMAAKANILNKGGAQNVEEEIHEQDMADKAEILNERGGSTQEVCFQLSDDLLKPKASLVYAESKSLYF